MDLPARASSISASFAAPDGPATGNSSGTASCIGCMTVSSLSVVVTEPAGGAQALGVPSAEGAVLERRGGREVERAADEVEANCDWPVGRISATPCAAALLKLSLAAPSVATAETVRAETGSAMVNRAVDLVVRAADFDVRGRLRGRALLEPAAGVQTSSDDESRSTSASLSNASDSAAAAKSAFLPRSTSPNSSSVGSTYETEALLVRGAERARGSIRPRVVDGFRGFV